MNYCKHEQFRNYESLTRSHNINNVASMKHSVNKNASINYIIIPWGKMNAAHFYHLNEINFYESDKD